MQAPKPRYLMIDCLRGVAILAVILLHINIHYPFDKSVFTQLPHAVVANIFWSGYYGVIIFFVISGFLITSHAYRRWDQLSQISVIGFYQLRIARILPCLLLLVLVLTVLHFVNAKGFVIHTTTLGRAVFAALTFHVNVLEAASGYLPANWDVLWSLSVEEAFYIFFPLLCLIFKRSVLLIVVLFVFIGMGPWARVHGYNEMWQDHGYLSCFDSIAMGVLAAMIARQYTLQGIMRWGLCLLGGLLCVLVFGYRKLLFDVGISSMGLNVSMLALGIACWLIVCSQKETVAQAKYAVVARLLAWYGQRSYEMYLTHLFVVIVLKQIASHWAVLSTIWVLILWSIVVLVMSAALGAIIAHCYAGPSNRWLRGLVIANVACERGELVE